MDDMQRRALAELEKKSNNLLRGYVLELTSRVKRDTPVDTGRARSNWNVSVGKPDTRTFEAGDERSSYAQQDTKKTAENARAVGQVNFWRGDIGWLANGLRYIRLLEQGSSKQAPSGMVRINIEGMRPWLTKEAAKAGVR